ncbi:MAG: uracil-DNA glycosylase family protein [Deltaproteobacteria bacterium]|nr:uracil-DNA glycosylase family protein [Deltaproteobacteria bacterium]
MIKLITKPDPRSKTGPFELLLNDIQNCKADSTICPALNTRQFYFEPNSQTAPYWKKEGCFTEQIDYRLMFICESPGPSAKEGSAEVPERCFGSPGDRFQKVRQQYGLANCYITNTVKCGVRQGGKHSLTEVEACRKFLVREIDLVEPAIIVAVGGNAFQTLRTEIWGHLKIAPILYQITHYSSRRNVWDAWDSEFPELLRLLTRLRPREEWGERRNIKLSDKPLKIVGEECGTRIVSELFKAGDRYVFFDIGWPDAALNPIHWIGKLVSEKDGVMVFQDDTHADIEPEPRTYTISPITTRDKYYNGGSMLDDVNEWRQWQKDNGYGEEQAKEVLQERMKGNVDIQ